MPTINYLLSLPFTVKIATRDFHPPDHISFCTSHDPPNNKAFESSTTIANPKDPSETTTIPLWPPHCIQGTQGAYLIQEIDIAHIDTVIDKGRARDVEMFSSFADAFGNTFPETENASFNLAEYLRQEGIPKVFVVGLAGDYCVRCTAVDARKEGFDVFIVEEGVRSIDEKAWEGAKKEMEEMGIRFVGFAGEEERSVGSV